MNYPNGGTPPTSLIDQGSHALAPAAHAVHSFAFTGGDVVGLVLTGAIAVLGGALLLIRSRRPADA